MSAQPRIVILGAGFAGIACIQELTRLQRRCDLHVTLVDRNNYFLFYPLLVEAGTGSLEPRHVVAPVRAFIRGRSTRFVMAKIEGIDLARRVVIVRPTLEDRAAEIPYDQLVIALGSVTRLPEVPGLRAYGYEIKSLADAVALRDRAITVLEAANAATDRDRRRALLHFVVVGANFTGVEVAGEFQAFLGAALRRYPALAPADFRVTLIEIAGRILGPLHADLADYARRHLEARGVGVRVRTTVRAIEEDRVTLDSGETLAASTVIWCAGIAPSPLIGTIGLPTDELGYILCDDRMRVRGSENVWSVGDCAVNPDPDGRPYPPTAQHAARQGRQLARNLLRALTGGTPEPLRYKTAGSLVALGCRTGVAQILGLKLVGFPAWWLYRSVYLMKMPGFMRKLRVAIDWTLEILFPRDFVQLGVHRGGSRFDPDH